MSRIYYRSAKAAVICYDVTDADSFEKVKLWVGELSAAEPECTLYVVANKSQF
jgi:Ras-related protein Rab-24